MTGEPAPDYAGRVAFALGHIEEMFAGTRADGLESLNALVAQRREDERIKEWWAKNHGRQVERVREALAALGIYDPVNYTGEVRNFRAEAAEARVAEVERERDEARDSLHRCREDFHAKVLGLSDLRRQMDELRAQGNWPVADVVARAEAAEARVAALTEALHEISIARRSGQGRWRTIAYRYETIAREALAAGGLAG